MQAQTWRSRRSQQAPSARRRRALFQLAGPAQQPQPPNRGASGREPRVFKGRGSFSEGVTARALAGPRYAQTEDVTLPPPTSPPCGKGSSGRARRQQRRGGGGEGVGGLASHKGARSRSRPPRQPRSGGAATDRPV